MVSAGFPEAGHLVQPEPEGSVRVLPSGEGGQEQLHQVDRLPEGYVQGAQQGAPFLQHLIRGPGPEVGSEQEQNINFKYYFLVVY